MVSPDTGITPQEREGIRGEIQLNPWKRLGRIDNVPLPSPEMLSYIDRQDTLRYKGLVLHMLTTAVVADTIMQGIQQANQSEKDPANQLVVNPDVTLETMSAYHAPRPLADEGAKGQSTPAINHFMETHDDMDLATVIAIRNGLPLRVVEGIESLQGSRGALEKTIGPDNPDRPGVIDWSMAITQVASWCVARTIQPMSQRFDEMRQRHAGIKDSPKKLSLADYDRLQSWGEARVDTIAQHIGIEPHNFFDWLKSKIHEGADPSVAKESSDNLIRELFTRDPGENEFLPISPTYRYLATKIQAIQPNQIELVEGETQTVRHPSRKSFDRLLRRP